MTPCLRCTRTFRQNMKKILAFAKRELKSHFDHPGGYVILVVFLGLVLFLYFRSMLVAAEASLRPLFDILPWLLLFLVPAITMRSLAADEKEGTSEVFLSQPITALQYLTGKYLGSLFAVLIAVFATAPLLAVLAQFGAFDWGLAAAQYIGTVFLVGALCAIGFFTSGLTKNQIVAFILSIAIIFLFIGVFVKNSLNARNIFVYVAPFFHIFGSTAGNIKPKFA